MCKILITLAFIGIFWATTAHTPVHVNPINNQLIQAVIQVESRGNPKAISKKGSLGLMQIRFSVWGKELKKVGIKRLLLSSVSASLPISLGEEDSHGGKELILREKS